MVQIVGKKEEETVSTQRVCEAHLPVSGFGKAKMENQVVELSMSRYSNLREVSSQCTYSSGRLFY